MATPLIVEAIADEFKELSARLRRLSEALEIIPVDEDDLRRMVPDYNAHMIAIMERFQKTLLVCIKFGVMENPLQPTQPTQSVTVKLVDAEVIIADSNAKGVIPEECQTCADRGKCFPPHTLN